MAPPYVATALALSVQEWTMLGLGAQPDTSATDRLDVLVDRVTALLTVRLAAVLSPPRHFADLSCTTICRSVLMREEEWPVSEKVLEQLRSYVATILAGYNSVPYHNREHAYHVILSTNKLVDMMLESSKSVTFGLKRDPLALLAVVFSALIHDVEHQGVPNRQLAAENDELAILYNDQSIAENRSLFIGFSELLKPSYKDLRQAMFGAESAAYKENYMRFRKLVVDLVLNTDIASPERTQLAKSKYNEAFARFITARKKKMADEDSLTPDDESVQDPHDDLDGVVISAKTLSLSNNNPEDENEAPAPPTESPALVRRGRRKTDGGCPDYNNRRSSNGASTGGFRKRLGIRRSMDLSGEALETYSRHESIGYGEDDSLDELKATVVLETILTTADVAHNLQGWDHLVKWSGRLYMELRKAFVEGRGTLNPESKWFENQIGFLESYLFPLAQRLEDTGVFGENSKFVASVESNRDKWLTNGLDVTADIVAEGAKVYPF